METTTTEKGKISNRRMIGYLLLIAGILVGVIFGFVKMSYDAQGAYLCENITITGGDMNACPVHKTDTSWLFVGGFSISAILIAAGIYLGFIEKPRTDTHAVSLQEALPHHRVITPVNTTGFDTDTKTVYAIIHQSSGTVFQSELIKKTNFSKVKISRILDKLEQDNVIERRRRGMANLIVHK